jgi:hypothetical protein
MSNLVARTGMLVPPGTRAPFPCQYYVISELGAIRFGRGRAEESKEEPERPAVWLGCRGVERSGGPHTARRTEEIGIATATAVGRISMRSKAGARLSFESLGSHPLAATSASSSKADCFQRLTSRALCARKPRSGADTDDRLGLVISSRSARFEKQ